MKCPNCQSEAARVVDARTGRRKRICKKCGHAFFTVEVIECSKHNTAKIDTQIRALNRITKELKDTIGILEESKHGL